MTRLKVVQVDPIAHPIRKSPGFEKKGLSTYALDIMGLCEYGCRYCSSNHGNYLRINREAFADATEEQLGERLYPGDSPSLTFHWRDIEERLARQLQDRKRSFGEGHTLVFSMLTDGFSPSLVASGTTRRVLDLVLARTSFRIRVLTKNACVGSADWRAFFRENRERFVVGLSTGTLDDAWAKRVEIGTSPPSARIKALHRLQDDGVATYGMLCPIFPAALDHAGVELQRLIDAVRPDRCETVWSEPYNDRANWRHVQAGYDVGSPAHTNIERLFTCDGAWSSYATKLALRLRSAARTQGWIDRLVYLLYEDGIDEASAKELGSLIGISLQSKRGPDGLSLNPHIAALQREVARG